MRCLAICCLLLATLLPAWAGEATGSGRLWLKDADNGDALVGPNPQQGIPQGHTLKVAIGGLRDGKKLAAGARCAAVLCDGSQELARAELALNDTAYGEAQFPLGDGMKPGIYQIRLDRDGQTTGLGGTFRVIEGAPDQNLPFGAGGAVLALLAVLGGVALARRRPRPV